jgi:uncharacterized membrane protein
VAERNRFDNEGGSLGANMRKKDACFVCGNAVENARKDNYIEDQVICDKCRDEMFDSLEKAWKKHSAFLDAALN